MLIIGLDDQGLSKYVSVWKSSELGFFRHDLFCCCCVVLPTTLFAMSRVSYLLVRGSFNLAFLVTFAFYFQVVKVTKSFGIKKSYFYWWADAIYHCKCTNNVPTNHKYSIRIPHMESEKKLHLLLYFWQASTWPFVFKNYNMRDLHLNFWYDNFENDKFSTKGEVSWCNLFHLVLALFPQKFEFLNSDSAWKRLLKWLHLNSRRFSNP